MRFEVVKLLGDDSRSDTVIIQGCEIGVIRLISLRAKIRDDTP